MPFIKKLKFLIIISLLISFSFETEYEIEIGGKKIIYNAQVLVDEDLTIEEDYISSQNGETIFLVVGGSKLTIKEGVTITKEISNSRRRLLEDENSLEELKYGKNSVIVVIGSKTKAIINGATITTNGQGSHGIVSINSGDIEINESKITTMSDNSKGFVSVLRGGIKAENVEITTKGNSSPCIEGDGDIQAIGMTLNTEGLDSPFVYSLGIISIFSSNGIAKQSQISIIEGPHSLLLSGCEFTCGGQGKTLKSISEDENGEIIGNAGILIFYESHENTGLANLDCSDSNFVVDDSENGLSAPLIFASNNLACINLNHVIFSINSGVFMKSMGHSDVSLTSTDMEIKGDIVAKGISTINLKYDCSKENNEFNSEGSVTSECL